MRDFAGTMRALIPYMERFGYVMGKVVYYSLLVIAKIVKVVADTLIRLWNKMKPVVDFARRMAQNIKELVGWLLAWYRRNKDIIDVIGLVIGGLLAFELGTRLAMGAVNLFIGALQGAWGAVKALGEILANTNLAKLLKLSVEGVQAALGAIESVGRALGSLANKGINLAVTGVDQAISGIKRVGDELAKLVNKTVRTDTTNVTTNIKENVSKTVTTIGDGFGKALPGLSIIFAQGLGIALRAAAAHPLVAAGIAAVALVILAGIFPRETGQFSKIFLDNILAIFVRITALPLLITARLIDAFIDVFAEVVYQVGITVKNLFSGLFDIVKETVAGVFGGIKDLVVGIITGDWERALRGALKILDTLFIELPMHLFTLFFDEAKRWVTDVFPKLGAIVWQAFKDIFDMLYDIVSTPLEAIWNFFGDWIQKFAGGWASEQWNKLTKAVKDVMNSIWDAFTDIFDFRGSRSIKNAVVNTFDAIRDFIAGMPNPFKPILDFLQGILDKADYVRRGLNLIPGVDIKGGGGGNDTVLTNSGSSTTARVGASIASMSVRYAWDAVAQRQIIEGISYQITRSHWSNESAQTAYVFIQGTEPPDLSQYTHGGIVPGRRGQRVPVLAEAGEMFLGHPDFAQGSGRAARALGASGGDTHVYFDLRGSAIGEEGLKKLAQTVASSLVGNLAGNRSMTFHRIGG